MLKSEQCYYAHQLIWLKPMTYLPILNFSEWVMQLWDFNEPVIVRRDHNPPLIPVGIRGYERHQRQALWIKQEDIHHYLSPVEVALYSHNEHNQQRFKTIPAFNALQSILKQTWPFEIGVTGSLGISLVSQKQYVTPTSDLDLTIHCHEVVPKQKFNDFYTFIQTLPTRVDVQIETPQGGFSLHEWIHNPTVMLKTDLGPIITNNAWEATSL